MNITRLLTLLTFFLAFGLNAKNTNTPCNKFFEGKRVGQWYLDENNQPVTDNDSQKASEGKYVNGRKEGVWIYYYEDGKTPRLIGEYSDNRPSGTYFRFNRQGKLCSANANSRVLKNSNRIGVSNKVYSCQLNFENQDLVAGQVFFSNKLFVKNSFRFWVTRNFETSNATSSKIDFSWLHNSYNMLYASYLEVRKPSRTLVKPQTLSVVTTTVRGASAPPLVKNPIVADGLEFKLNGMNKLYSKTGEIWMDGYFEQGQLRDGKVFLYDNDGVLLKVRIYKKGKYLSDGGL